MVLRSELVVVEDVVLGHSEDQKQQGGQHAGAVLARGAVEDGRQARLVGQPGEDATEGRRETLQEVQVHLGEERLTVRQGGVDIGRAALGAGRDDRHHLDGMDAIGQPVGDDLPLGVGADVVDGPDPEPGEGIEVRVVQREGVRAEYPAPPDPGPLGCPVAPEVPEVAGTRERQVPFPYDDATAAAARRQ